MTKTEKFWNLVEGLCSPLLFGFPIKSVMGSVTDQRQCIMIMQYVPSSFLEEARKRRLSVMIWSCTGFSPEFESYQYVEVWLSPDQLRWR